MSPSGIKLRYAARL
jgi:ribonuclease HI